MRWNIVYRESHRRAVGLGVLAIVVVGSIGLGTAQTGIAVTGLPFHLVELNTSIVLGQNYTFDNVTVYGDAVQFETGNVSVATNASAWVNATLWEYNLTAQDDTTVIKIATDASTGTNVSFAFTDVPTGDGSYLLQYAGDTLATYTGGITSWHHTYRNPPDNFTIVFNATTTESIDEDEHTSSSPVRTPDHCWRGVGTSFARDEPVEGLSHLEIDTVEDMHGPCLDVSAVDQVPAYIPMLDNVYRYYEFTLEGLSSEDVATAILTVDVDASFATQYDEIVVKWYTDEWEAVETTPVDITGETWLYEATADGFSYYAVHGINEEPGEEPDSPDDEPDEEQDEKVEDDEELPEDQIDEPAVDPDPVGPERTNRVLLIAAGVLLMTVLGGAGYYVYRTGYNLASLRAVATRIASLYDEGAQYEREDVEALQREVLALIDEKGVQHHCFINTKLEQAEYALDHDSTDAARCRLQEIKDHLEQD